MSTGRKIALAIASPSLLGMFLLLVPLMVIVGIDDGRSACSSTGASPAGAETAPLSPDALQEIQIRNARTIIGVGEQMQVSEHGIVTALAAASQESGLRMLANDGTGQLQDTQRDVVRSLQFPHDGVGNDHGSVNFFQMQFPWWGTVEELMDPATAARKFYEALRRVSGWETMPVTQAAQAVEQSQFPDAYVDDEPIARGLYDRYKGSGAQLPAPSTTSGVPAPEVQMAAAATPSFVFPLPAGTYVTGDGWRTADRPDHRGIDFPAPNGTPILSPLAGTVVLSDSDPGGFGWWVVVDTVANGQPVSMVFGHMYQETVKVRVGQRVGPGQQIADVGSNGGSSGPHLHFEVWPGGRLTGGHDIDPGPWLAASGQITTAVPGSELGATSTADCGFGTPGGELAAGSVPPELEPWIRQAGAICPAIKPSFIAGQQFVESGHRADADSGVASGYAQFTDDTWRTYGRDVDGNGAISRSDPGDATMAQGHYMCDLYGWMEKGVREGALAPGSDPLRLATAAYNAGPCAIIWLKLQTPPGCTNINPSATDSMPSGGDYDIQTRPYVDKVLAAAPRYEAVGAQGELAGSPSGTVAIERARSVLGKPYVWGATGPDSFDCSGLVVWAYQGVSLPRTSQDQWTVGTEVPMDQAQPGDLVFGSWEGGGPGHVGIYIGGGQMIHAPTTGDVVKQAPVQGDMKARRIG